mmetsp:Transcript_49293/g.68490  ORF Transcript_49293/g.68490 Transcript_49293/m.68490 type:complete len:159 (-) Transcript_49293:507-983(-)
MEFASYGDLSKTVNKISALQDEKLVRTYFHQLIAGLEFMHTNGMVHHDIKFANLLLGDGYELKLADFDQSVVVDHKGRGSPLGRGTEEFRAPEVANGEERKANANLFKVDVYSAGIVLFGMMTGNLPYKEGSAIAGKYRLDELMVNDVKKFWEVHNKF